MTYDDALRAELLRRHIDDEIRQMEGVEIPPPPTLPGVPLTDDQARDLSRAAKHVTSWTERRNTLIREAVAGGAGVREVARACGLNHATVLNIIKPRGRQ